MTALSKNALWNNSKCYEVVKWCLQLSEVQAIPTDKKRDTGRECPSALGDIWLNGVHIAAAAPLAKASLLACPRFLPWPRKLAYTSCTRNENSRSTFAWTQPSHAYTNLAASQSLAVHKFHWSFLRISIIHYCASVSFGMSGMHKWAACSWSLCKSQYRCKLQKRTKVIASSALFVSKAW